LKYGHREKKRQEDLPTIAARSFCNLEMPTTCGGLVKAFGI
jgi:hypothetical protein